MPAPDLGSIGIIDCMIGFPTRNPRSTYEFLQPGLRDDDSRAMQFPAEYLFKDVPTLDIGADDEADDAADDKAHDEADDGSDVTLREMDRHGIAVGLVGLGSPAAATALEQHPDRFIASLEIDPNHITRTVRQIQQAHVDHGIKAVSTFPSGCNPPVPVSDRRYYPIYQACIDRGLPIIVNAGIAGPRLPSDVQHVMHFDQVCYDFPELVIVMRHGAEPWEDLAVKLMLKWPGLHYMTSAFAPKYYPTAIIDFANTRGTDKILYAGYYPMGLTLERIFAELPHVPFRDHVWAPFLRENAARVLNL